MEHATDEDINISRQTNKHAPDGKTTYIIPTGRQPMRTYTSVEKKHTYPMDASLLLYEIRHVKLPVVALPGGPKPGGEAGEGPGAPAAVSGQQGQKSGRGSRAQLKKSWEKKCISKVSSSAETSWLREGRW